MAAKRVSVSAINWTAFAERVPKEDLSKFQALKARNDSYIRRVAANPDSLPRIDWNYYKSRIAVPGMVDNFQKSYESLKIPYPSDKGLIAQINEQENEMKKSLDNFRIEIDQSLEDLKKQLQVLEAQIPFSEMTVEEYWIANKDNAIDLNNPTFFPHDEEARKATKEFIEKGHPPIGHH